MNTKRIIKLTLCLAFLSSFAISVLSQKPVGRIHGTATDEFGAVISGAAVELKINDMEHPQSLTTTTNNDGEFTFENLESGEYSINININFNSKLSYKNEKVKVILGQTIVLNTRLCVGGCDADINAQKISLTDADKADIVNQLLKISLVDKRIPDYQLLMTQKGKIIVSSENIKAEWIKPIPGVNLRIISAAAVQEKANKSGDFLYISFEFKEKQNGVVVNINNGWAVGVNSSIGYLSGGGCGYFFHREAGKWIGEIFESWIS